MTKSQYVGLMGGMLLIFVIISSWKKYIFGVKEECGLEVSETNTHTHHLVQPVSVNVFLLHRCQSRLNKTFTDIKTIQAKPRMHIFTFSLLIQCLSKALKQTLVSRYYDKVLPRNILLRLGLWQSFVGTPSAPPFNSERGIGLRQSSVNI
jgi:hypothetical protein